MKWWICLTALVLALTTSAAAADLPAELERAAPEAAEDLTGGDLSGGTGFAQGVGNILDRLADQVGDVVRERTRGAAAVLLVVVLLPKKLLKKKKKKKPKKNPMMTWVSVYSIKEFSQTNK